MAPTNQVDRTPITIAVVVGVVGLALLLAAKLIFDRRRRHLRAALQHNRERQRSQPSVQHLMVHVSQYRPPQPNRAVSKFCIVLSLAQSS